MWSGCDGCKGDIDVGTESRGKGKKNGVQKGRVEGQSTTWAGRQTMCTYKAEGFTRVGQAPGRGKSGVVWRQHGGK